MAQKELLQFSTNAADDSKGVAFGLSGNLFLYVIGGAILALLLVILFNGFLKLHIAFSVGVGAIPLLVATLYVVFMVNNKPPHYQDDWVHTLLGCDSVVFGHRDKYHPLLRETNQGRMD